MPAFRQVLAAVARRLGDPPATSSRPRHDDRRGHARARLDLGAPAAAVAPRCSTRAVAALAGDATTSGRGGFGGAPKFPPSMVLEFLLRHHARTGDGASAADGRAARCEAMARGGMYDQLAGGFARYSVDAQWVVPHFEKMLYDNALLLRVYLHLWRATGDELARRVADETADFLLRDLRTAEGGFASALDADTDGVEGLTYVWTPDQLVEVLGADDGRWAAELFEVTDARHLRARRLDAAAAGRPRRRRPRCDVGAGAAARGPGAAAAAGAGRQGGHRLERAGDRRARRARACSTGADGVGGRGRARRRPAGRHALGRRPAAPGLAGRCGRPARRGARGLRRLAEGLLALHQATGEGRWLDAGRRPARRRRRAVRRRRTGWLRHRRRRRGAGAPAATRPTARRRPGIAAAAGRCRRLRAR